VSDEMIAWKTEGTKLYQALPGQMQNHWKEAEPLTQVPSSIPNQSASYKTWKNDKTGD
jgi:phenylacetic acid degradation protein/carnitine operon protein CaiE